MYATTERVHHAYMRKPVRKPVRRPPVYRRTFIRKWREFRERTLEDLAEKVGITHATLSRIERGLLPYSQAIIESIATELLTDVTSLLSRDPNDQETIWPIWDQAKPNERQMIVDIAKTIVKSNS